jgi:CBS domain-containing protein
LAGSLSTSDLKGLKPETLEWLQQPVLLFLSKVHGDRVPEPIVVHSAVSVQQIMEKMVNFKTHRVWVVDGRDQPIGVITMTDIVRVFLEWE